MSNEISIIKKNYYFYLSTIKFLVLSMYLNIYQVSSIYYCDSEF